MCQAYRLCFAHNSILCTFSSCSFLYCVINTNMYINSALLCSSPCCSVADLNECQLQGVCPNGDCLNTMGSYRCSCKAGFIPDPTLSTCIRKSFITLPVSLSLCLSLSSSLALSPSLSRSVFLSVLYLGVTFPIRLKIYITSACTVRIAVCKIAVCFECRKAYCKGCVLMICI